MAAIISDGPRAWALDTLDRHLGRAVAAITGIAMLVSVHIVHPGPARGALAIGSVLLVLRSTIRPPAPAVTLDDLAEVEEIVLRLRSDVDARTELGFDRLDRITDIIVDVHRRVR